MQIVAIAVCLDLLMVMSPSPTSKEATILPPPANRVPCNPFLSWMVLSLPRYPRMQSIRKSNPK